MQAIERIRAALSSQDTSYEFLQFCKVCSMSEVLAHIDKLEAENERLRKDAPSWQDAPTCAGVWVRNSGDCIGAYLIHESAIPILQGSRSRWFGPLPEDKQ